MLRFPESGGTGTMPSRVTLHRTWVAETSVVGEKVATASIVPSWSGVQGLSATVGVWDGVAREGVRGAGGGRDPLDIYIDARLGERWKPKGILGQTMFP